MNIPMNLEKLGWFLFIAQNLSDHDLLPSEIHEALLKFNNLTDKQVDDLLELEYSNVWENGKRID